MMTANHPLIFDGHNDVLTRLLMAGGKSAADTFLTGRKGHIDLDRARAGGFGGGFFAIWVPSPDNIDLRMKEMRKPRYDLPLPAGINTGDALDVVLAEAAVLYRLEELDALKVCTTTADIRSCMSSGTLAAILHIEGAEAIDTKFHALEVLYRAGLRSLGPVWSRPTSFGEGVPFRFPGSPDIGGGLTEHGFALVDRCNELGIMIDLSHLNEAGFWDVAKRSRHPLVATHSNAHALCPHPRNLTDKQLQAIAGSDGMVGLNFAVAFLRADGRMQTDVPISQMLRHLDHLLSILGQDRVGIGSDFDGAMIPDEIGDVTGLPVLRRAMSGHGYSDDLIEKICYRNWLRVLDLTWGTESR